MFRCKKFILSEHFMVTREFHFFQVMGEHEVLGITEDSDLKLDVLGINKE